MRMIVLDRDGVINLDRKDYVKSPTEWKPIPGSLEALGELTRAGYEIAIATNQSGIGRGLYSADDVRAIHEQLRREAGRHGARIAGFYVCPHAPLANCDCRKPRSGLLRAIARDFDLKPDRLTFIGDTGKDLAAARDIGARGLLVLTGQGARTLINERAAGREPAHYPNLAAAVETLVASSPGILRRILGSLAYNAGYVITICFYSAAAFTCSILPYGRRGLEVVAHAYAVAFYGLLKLFVRLDYHIEGREHLPAGPFVFYWKHQSTWETLAPFLLVRRPAFVLKRELLWIPLVGWALARLGAVGINRRAHRKAIDQILNQGKRLLERGSTLVIFPEGHRMPPGTTRRYGLSGALLARAAGVPIVPVALNSGDFWPRRGFIKRPGTVRLRIGPPIATEDRSPEAINLEAKAWIEAQMQQISIGYLQAQGVNDIGKPVTEQRD
ncbi:MAG: D-glycero-beta-D-manno-heptose 1,7-bisphosphate 7-phosphatase [Gammaproteobacteria bacterium]